MGIFETVWSGWKLQLLALILAGTPLLSFAQESEEASSPAASLSSDPAAIFTGTPQESVTQDESIKNPLERLLGKDRALPMFFDPKSSGVTLPKQVIDYDLSDPLVLRMGPWQLTGEQVFMGISRERAEFLDVDFGIDVSRRRFQMYLVSFTWPKDFLANGVLEIIDDQNRTIWSRKIESLELDAWQEILNRKRPLVVKTGQEGPQATITLDPRRARGVHAQSLYGLTDREFFEIPIWKIKKPFRFCLTQDSIDGRLAVCSKRYNFVRSGGVYMVESASGTVTPHVLINDKSVARKGSAIFLNDKTPIKFAALLGDGTYYEFISSPQPLQLVDMVLDDESGFVEVTGFGNRPMGDIEVVEIQPKDALNFLNFMPTIGDLREFWKTKFPSSEPYIYLKGKGGAPFKQSFIYESLPRLKARPFLAWNSPRSTYSSEVKLRGLANREVTLSSSQKSVDRGEGAEFQWIYSAAEKGVSNRSEMEVSDAGQKYPAYFEIYRGYPGELSLRTTGVLTDDAAVVLLGEVAGQYWMDHLLGWDHYSLSRQRWGLAFKYFQSLASFGGEDESSELIKLQVMNADLKYRLTPGVWGRDGTLGLSLNAQSVVIEQYEANMLGAGFFWARSMPLLFDSLFNIMPFLRYPKWVDLEFIYYPISPDATKQLQVNSALNFHGKIQWSPRVFGEGGFGLKTFVFDDLEVRKRVSLGVVYGTLGLGINF